jgi:hypothetical protein
VVNVDVGNPWSLVATTVESESHGGSSWVGAAMQRGRNGRICQDSKGLEEGVRQSGESESAGIGAVTVRCSVMGRRENVDSSCKNCEK